MKYLVKKRNVKKCNCPLQDSMCPELVCMVNDGDTPGECEQLVCVAQGNNGNGCPVLSCGVNF